MPNRDLDASRPRPFDQITKRSYFSSELAQIETSCTLSYEAAPASGSPANSTLAFEWERLGGADAQVVEGMGKRKAKIYLPDQSVLTCRKRKGGKSRPKYVIC